MVRCAHCAHTWHQETPAVSTRVVDIPTPPPPPPRPASFDPSPSIEEREPFAHSLPGLEAEPETEPVKRGLPALPQKRRFPWMAAAWTGLGLLVVAGIAGVYVARNQIVEWWPPSARLYTTLHIPVELPGEGLELRRVSPTRETENGLPTLVIQGEVANISEIARRVPKLKVVLRDGGDRELQSWSFILTEERLQPGTSMPFRTSISQPSDAATGLLVTFVVPGQ